MHDWGYWFCQVARSTRFVLKCRFHPFSIISNCDIFTFFSSGRVSSQITHSNGVWTRPPGAKFFTERVLPNSIQLHDSRLSVLGWAPVPLGCGKFLPVRCKVVRGCRRHDRMSYIVSHIMNFTVSTESWRRSPMISLLSMGICLSRRQLVLLWLLHSHSCPCQRPAVKIERTPSWSPKVQD